MSTSVSGDGDEKFQISIREDTGRDVETPSDASKSGFTAEDERRLVRKLDMRIMPTVCLIYLFACECLALSHLYNPLFIVMSTPFLLDLDRTNLGNARLQGLPKDVLGGDPTGVLFDWVNSAFFFSYVRFLPWTLHITPTHAGGVVDNLSYPSHDPIKTIPSSLLARKRIGRMGHLLGTHGTFP